EEVDAVVRHLARQRRALGLEVGDQVAKRRGVEQRARELVRPEFPALLEHRDRERLAAVGLLQLGQLQRRRQPGRAAADDEDIDFERLAFHYAFSSSATRAGAISNRSPAIP